MTSPDTWRAQGVCIPGPASARDLALFVRETGEPDAPAVLFLHGFPTSSRDWSRIAPAFSDRRALYPDLLGFGLSSKPRIRYTYSLQADLIAALMRARGIGRVSLIVHDYAVTLAQELLLREARGRLGFGIDRVVFLNGGVYGRLHRKLRVHRLLLMPVLGSLVARRSTPERLATGLNAVAGAANAWSLADAQAHWRDMAANDGLANTPRLLHYIADRRTHGAAWEEAMEAAQDRLAFVWGPKDPVSGAHVLDEVRRRMTRARIITLEGVGHYPHWEAPERAAAAIRAGLISA